MGMNGNFLFLYIETEALTLSLKACVLLFICLFTFLFSRYNDGKMRKGEGQVERQN